MIIFDDIDAYYRLAPAQFSHLKILSFDRDYGGKSARARDYHGYDVKIILGQYKEERELVICCNNVLHIKIGTLDFGDGICLSIDNISSYQWEGIHFKVSDLENDVLSFVCKSFNAEVKSTGEC